MTNRTNFRATVHVRLKKGLLDPQGKAIQGALATLGFQKVEHVRVGKLIDIDLDAQDEDEAKRKLEQMCSKLLANPVIEEFHFELKPAAS